jgi:hypothetical protein
LLRLLLLVLLQGFLFLLLFLCFLLHQIWRAAPCLLGLGLPLHLLF